MSDTVELYKKFRPGSLSLVVGQDAAVQMFRSFGKDNMPHAVLLSGPSGCGKTTLARIGAAQVGCVETEVYERNCADERGIDLIRALIKQSHRTAFRGTRKAFILDEVHALTKDAQSALLKELEDTPTRAYYFLCTTDSPKLLPTIVTRCTEVKVKPLNSDEISSVLARVIKRAKLVIDAEALAEVIVAADGSARKALVLLNQIAVLPKDQQLAVVNKSELRSKGVDLARLLVYGRPAWAEVSTILAGMEDDVETVRRIVLGFARGAILKGGALGPKAAFVIDRFQTNFFDSGAAGLALACWEVVSVKK